MSRLIKTNSRLDPIKNKAYIIRAYQPLLKKVQLCPTMIREGFSWNVTIRKSKDSWHGKINCTMSDTELKNTNSIFHNYKKYIFYILVIITFYQLVMPWRWRRRRRCWSRWNKWPLSTGVNWRCWGRWGYNSICFLEIVNIIPNTNR